MAKVPEMRAVTFLILTALADGAKHGYALLAEIELLSGGQVQLQVGSLYAALERLQGEGLLVIAHESEVMGRLRRYLALTDAGRSALEGEVLRMELVAAKARDRLNGRRAGTPALGS